MANSPAARKTLERDRKRLRGLVRVEVWIPDTPEAREALAAFVAQLAA